MKLRNKVVAAVSATVMTAGMVMSSVPAFAGSEEMDFINSYNGEVRQWAQYVIDEGCTLEEAQELVDSFIEGEKAFREESNASSGISTCADGSGEEYDEELGYYYDRENYAPSKHYVAIISEEPSIAIGRLNLYFDGVNSRVLAPKENSYRACFKYSSMISIKDDLNPKNGLWDYTLSVTGIDSVESLTSTPLLIFPIEKGVKSLTENDLHKNINFSCMMSPEDGVFAFETFAMGDLNHNGKVTYADTYLLEKYLIGVEPDLNYTGGVSPYAKAVKLVASDVDQNDKISLSDVIYLNKFIGGSYEM